MKFTVFTPHSITMNLVLIGMFCVFLNNSFGQVVQDFQCEGVRENDYVRNISDCRGWIRCKGSNPHIFGLCPGERYFDETNQKCNADNSTCFACPSDSFINIYVDNSCNRFVRCLKGVATEQICEEGLQFNTVSGQCDLETNVRCTKEPTCSINLAEGDWYAFRDPANCSIGFLCAGEKNPYKTECGPELHYKIDIPMCGLKNNSGCVDI